MVGGRSSERPPLQEEGKVSEERKVLFAEQVFQDWLEQRDFTPYFSTAQIKALVVLNERMPNVLEDRGLTFDGLSYRPGAPMSLLIVKASEAGEPLVCFINAKTFLNGIVIFLRMLSEERVPWKLDKFRKLDS